MGVSVRQLIQAAITGGGPTQDFTISGFGTVKAAIVICTLGTANNVDAVGAAISYGITDGTRQYAVSASAEDKLVVAVANARNAKSVTKTVHMVYASAVYASATAALIADGIRLTWTTLPTTPILMTVILFGGSDLDAYVGDFTSSANVNTNTVVTGLGFQADNIIIPTNQATALETIQQQASIMVGYVDRGPPIVQCCAVWHADYNGANAADHARVSTVYANVNDLAQNAIEITGIGAIGFTATTRIAGSAKRFPYLALGYNGFCGHAVEVRTAPQLLGTHTVSNYTFTPQYVQQVTGACTSTTARQTADVGGAGTFGVTSFTAFEISSSSIVDDDAASTQNSISMVAALHRCKHINTSNGLFENTHVGTNLPTFTTTGWTQHFSTAHPTTRYWPTLVIGEYVGPTGTTHDGVTGPSLTALFTVIATGRSVWNGAAAPSMAFTVSGTAGLIRNAQVVSNFAVLAQGNGTVFKNGQAAPAAAFTVAANGTVIAAGKAAPAMAFSIAANPDATIHLGQSLPNMAFTIAAVGKVTYGGKAAPAAAFTVAANGLTTINAAAALTAAFSTTLNGSMITMGKATPSMAFTVTPTGRQDQLGAAIITAAFTVTPEGTAADIGTWNSYGTPLVYVAADNLGMTYAFECYMRATTGRVNARLYNVTDAVPVAGSELFTESTIFVTKTSPPIALVDGKTYVAQFARSTSGAGEVKSASPVPV